MTNIVAHTANILGILLDPFEFEGDYGSDVNPIRQKVFDLVVSKVALAKNLPDLEVQQYMQARQVDIQDVGAYRNHLVAQAIEEERKYGPTLSELVTPDLLKEIGKKQGELQYAGFLHSDLEKIVHFVDSYGDEKVFHFLRNNPSELLSLDKILRDRAVREGTSFNLPLLSSMQPLVGENSFACKEALLEAVFTKEILGSTKPPSTLKQSLSTLDPLSLQGLLGPNANTEDLEVFSSAAGQVFFYWMYHALNLHLVSDPPDMIEQINRVKDIFSRTLGNSAARASAFKDKIVAAESGIVFTQESDDLVPQALMKDGLFLPIDRQNPQDGSFVFLKSTLWEPNYERIAIEDYEGAKKGRMNVILATLKETQQKFLLASCHGHSTDSEDGRRQIRLIMQQFNLLPSNENPQLVIGIDANTKTKKDVEAFRKLLDEFGLTSTSVGPTTVKRRMVTVQHAKAGKFAIDEEDYLITLKPEHGHRLSLTHPTVGFRDEYSDITQALPNMNNLSDHYPVGATLLL